MEAVPRLHMLWFALKSSPEGTSFSPLKKYIAEFYQEDAETYSKEVHALETLRNQAMRTTKDGSAIMKRYYCQLHALQNRFPQLTERGIFSFTWKDLYHSQVHEINDMRYERAAVLFNIAASHTQSGASVTRGDVDGMKMACTHFQAAAWAYGELRERYSQTLDNHGDFLTIELLVFMQQVCFAQAQECILEKSLIDNRKPHIVAKVTAQIVVYYGAALAALLTGGDDGPVAQVIDSSVYKLWKKYVRFKINYLNCILYLYQGQQAEEQRKMGERVTLYQAAWDKLEEARKESKGLPDQKEINESLTFTADVVEAKRKNAKNENEFIYHEAVPELSTIAAVQGANLVNGIGFSVTDEEFANTDLFSRLVPMQAHEASSLYSEEKAKLLRKYGALIEAKDTELNGYMSSLSLDNLNINEEQANKLPQGIVDRCAALHANKSAISDLIGAMSQLAEITSDVEGNLSELSHMLEAEAEAEREFQTASGVQRAPNAHIAELTREYQKYNEAHSRAGDSNNTLRKAMSLHVNNLKMLAKPLTEIQQLVPKLSADLNTAEIFKDVKLLVHKVNEMKAQRAQFHADLRIAVSEDDITAKLIAHGQSEGMQALFVAELGKHERITQLVDQNLLAQANILQALTDAYARAAPVLKTLQDVRQKREHFFTSLAASYDVYEDLLAKSAKGLEFYKKLAGNVQKLLTRFKSARDVQSEERQQRLKSVQRAAAAPPPQPPTAAVAPPQLPTEPSINSNANSTPKLRDYLKAKASGVRPVPVGSENPAAYASAPNEPPPPYSLQQQQYLDPGAAGYTNPMYQQQQQHLAPPAYKPQASPNSQSLHGALNQLSINNHQEQQQPPPQQQQPSISYGNYSYPAQQPLYVATELPASLQAPYVVTNPQQQPLQQVPSYPPPSNYYPPVYNQSQAPPPSYSQNYPTYPAPAEPQQLQQLQQQPTVVGNPLQYTPATNLPLQYQPHQQQQQQQPLKQQQPQQQLLQQQSQQQLLQQQLSQQHQQPQQLQQQPQQHQQQQQLLQQQMQQQQPQQLHQQPQQHQQQQQQLLQQQMQQQQPQQLQQQTQPLQQPPQQQQQPQQQQPQQQQMQSPNAVVNPSLSFSGQPIATPLPHQYSVAPTEQQSNHTSYSNHPGYGFNSQTGIYDYSSGYQQDNSGLAVQAQSNSFDQQQQVAIVGTTDSAGASKSNLATGFDSPAIVSHTKAVNEVVAAATPMDYYNPPYGYHMMNNPTKPQQTLYMQSGGCTIATTSTSSSSAEYASSPQPQPPVAATPPPIPGPSVAPPVAPPVAPSMLPPVAPQVAPPIAPSMAPPLEPTNIDLLSDLPPMLPAPVLQPQVAPLVAPPQPSPPVTAVEPKETSVTTSSPPPPLPTLLPSTAAAAATKIGSVDNLSICSDLSSLENFDWDAVSTTQSTSGGGGDSKVSTFQMQSIDPFTNDEKTLKYFHKEVENYEKLMENLHVRMLNGQTQLSSKWRELQQKLGKQQPPPTTVVAKLFPEKNRSLDCLPYDGARVKLDRETDDYINAAHMQNLGAGCPHLIAAQTPQANTINDFWSMIWSEKARTVVCLHPSGELFDPFWPKELDKPTHYDDFTVTCVKVEQRSHCTEFHLTLTMHCVDAVLDLSLLQLNNQWIKGCPSQLLGIASNALQTHQRRCLAANTPTSPLIMNCLTGSERCELMAIGICAVIATQTTRPILINVVDVWTRICSQRQNSLRDATTLEQSMQIVLTHAHDVLNKHGITTSYQMKMAPQVIAKEQQQAKDPLNELDALWKLK